MTETSLTPKENYYKNFRRTNPSLLLGLILISLFTYIIPWIYIRNKDFKTLDGNAPDEKRAVLLLLIFPSSWIYISFIFKKLIIYNAIIQTIEYLGWSFIIFLILKYLYDFCMTFGRITKTKGIYWFILFLIPFLTIPAMQSELNSQFDRILIKKRYRTMYH